jgi:CspA family cold shock protein
MPDGTAIRHAGVVKWFDPQKGWGFITPDQRIPDLEKPDIFVHQRGLDDAAKAGLRDGARVTFLVGEHNGRTTAVEVHLAQ